MKFESQTPPASTTKRPFAPLEQSLIATSVLSFVVSSFAFFNLQKDDSYIFYSYARNIALSSEYSFNIGEAVNGTTSPLYTLLLSSVASLLPADPQLTLPCIGHAIALGAGLFVWLVVRAELRSSGHRFTAHLFPFLLLGNPLYREAIGMETPLAIALSVTAIHLYLRERWLPVAFALGLALLARPDTGLLWALLCGHRCVQHRRLPPIALILVPGLIALPWLLYAQQEFGSPLPSTLSVKLGQTASGRWGTGLIFLKGLLSAGPWGSRWVLAGYGALCLGAGMLALRRPKGPQGKEAAPGASEFMRLAWAWNASYLLVYGFVLNPPGYSWYYAPLSLGLSLYLCFSIERIVVRAKAAQRHRLFRGILLASFATMFGLFLSLHLRPADKKLRVYSAAASWLNKNAPPGSTVAANEVGILRYHYTQGPIIDALGLMTPDVGPHVAEADYDWYIHEFEPDYLMFNDPPRPVLESMTNDAWFRALYQKETVITQGGRSVGIYRRVPPLDSSP